MRLLLRFSVVVLVACEARIIAPGEIDPVTGEPPGLRPTPGVKGPTPVPFACEGPASPAPELPLRRLSRTEYVNTLTSFVRAAMPQSNAGILQGLAVQLAQVPDDTTMPLPGEQHGGFSRLDQTVQQSMIDSTYAVAVEAGLKLTRPAARLTELMGACATDASTANDASCLAALVAKLSPLAERHPTAAADQAFLAGVAGSTPVDPDAVADVLAVMLTGPGFLYHFESGAAQVDANVYALDAYELAAKLSYHFWQAPPDDELTGAAASGALLTDDGYLAQVKRLTTDPRADATLDLFFDQWFRLEELGSLNSRVGDPVYDAFAGADVPSAGLRAAMFDEVRQSVRWTVRHQGSLDGLLTDTRNFARRSELAALYGVAAWDGVAEPGPLPPERAGLLTRAAFLANDSANTRPVMKGLRIRNALLCDTVPPPPENVKVVPPELAPDLTTREVVEQLTEQEGTACIGCHGKLLNPMGFASEGFDALGRARTQQLLFDAMGRVTARKDVDTRSVPRVTSADATETSGIGELTKLIADSRRFDSCFARQYFRFTFRRAESPADSCALRALDEAARGATLADALAAAALRPEFKQRRITP